MQNSFILAGQTTFSLKYIKTNMKRVFSSIFDDTHLMYDGDNITIKYHGVNGNA